MSWGSAPTALPERATGAILWCGAFGTRYVSPVWVVVEPRGTTATASTRRSEAGLDGMANTCEPPINAVMLTTPKVLCRKAEGVNQNGEWSGAGIYWFPAADVAATGEQAGPNPSVGTCAERGKPVLLPQGTARREARPWECG